MDMPEWNLPRVEISRECKSWNELNETKFVSKNIPFGLVNLYEHTLEWHKTLILLGKIQIKEELYLKYNNMYIIYQPHTPKTGNAMFVGSKAIVNEMVFFFKTKS